MTMKQLCDDTFCHVLSYLDFKSAVKVTRLTSKKKLQHHRHHVWRQVFERHLFAPITADKNTVDYVDHCRQRRLLFENLIGSKSCKGPFSLPHRYFHFLPVLPPDDSDEWEYDTPPVDFDCPSFLLISPGVSGTMAFLDPFDGSLTIREVSNAIPTTRTIVEEETTLALAIMEQCKGTGSDNEQFVGDLIDESAINARVEYTRAEPTQVLLDLKEYFEIDLRDYYRIPGKNHYNGVDVLRHDDEVEVNFLGIDCKQVMDWDNINNRITETMVAVGRILSTGEQQSAPCMDFLAWKRSSRSSDFCQQRVCRVRSNYATIDMDPYFDRLYVSFPLHEGPFRRYDADVHVEDWHCVGGRVIAAYPFEVYRDRDDKDACGPRHFPEPLFIMNCRDAVSTFAIAPGAELVLVAPSNGAIELWKTGKELRAERISSIDIIAALKSSRDKVLLSEPVIAPKANTTLDAPHPDEAPTPAISPVVTSFHFPQHRRLDETGFVTLHHEHGQGCWLLLWKQQRDGTFGIVSTITLPLSPRRTPRIHYDGRRLIVCGQDQVGMIILVYHVLNTWEDIDHFAETRLGKEQSGGVANWQGNQVTYRNRIRHAAFGGLEFYDSVYMTANEQFLMINTKTGNLLGSPCGTDGLLVIDLEEPA